MYATLFIKSPEGQVQQMQTEIFGDESMKDLLPIPAEYLTEDWCEWSIWWEYSDLSERQTSLLFLSCFN